MSYETRLRRALRDPERPMPIEHLIDLGDDLDDRVTLEGEAEEAQQAVGRWQALDAETPEDTVEGE